MTELSERLDRWTDAGLLTDEQAEEILRFERRRPTSGGPADRTSQRGERRDRRSRGAEAVGYVGAALAVGATGLLLGEVWDELVIGGRLVLVALLAVLLGAGGLALRRAGAPPLQRLASVLLTAAVIGVGWFASLVGDEVLGLADADVGLLVGVAATSVALPAHLGHRRALPQLALLAALLLTAGALLARAALPPAPLWAGLLFWALGIAWLLLGAGRWVRPPHVAEVAGGIVGLVALQVASFDDDRLALLALAVVTAGALVVLAVASDRVHHLVVGAAGLFVLVPQLVFELFGDAIGAPATLLAVGLLLVLLAVGLGRAHREVTEPSPPATSSPPDGVPRR